MAVGILVGTMVAARRARHADLRPSEIWGVAFWLTLAGLVGARALFVVEYWRDFGAEPWRAFALWEGGMSAWGAILLGFPVAWWYTRAHRLSYGALTAAAAPALLLGDAIGRLGGAASHMYHGRPTTFPLAYVLDGVQRHAVGIELALASLVGALVVLFIERRLSSLVSGHWSFTPALVLAWYSLERFLLDFLRASDLPGSDLRYGGLTLAQFFSVGALAFVVVYYMVRWRTRPAWTFVL